MKKNRPGRPLGKRRRPPDLEQMGLGVPKFSTERYDYTCRCGRESKDIRPSGYASVRTALEALDKHQRTMKHKSSATIHGSKDSITGSIEYKVNGVTPETERTYTWPVL